MSFSCTRVWKGLYVFQKLIFDICISPELVNFVCILAMVSTKPSCFNGYMIIHKGELLWCFYTFLQDRKIQLFQ